jgi:cytoskeleton-associated protein 5
MCTFRVCADVINGVVSKCLAASKTKTREKGFEIIMLFIEIEKADIVEVCSDMNANKYIR